MITLDTTTFELLDHPQFTVPVTCRTAMRVRRWGEEPLRDWLKRRPQMALNDGCYAIKRLVWDVCSADLRLAVDAYLDRFDA